MKPIRESIIDPNKVAILDQYSFNRIFINMEDILNVNKSLLSSLTEYEQGATTESFGEILLKHFAKFNCYKVFLLGKSNSLDCHTQNIKQNKNYSKFLLNKDFKGNLGMSDVLISPIQRMARYTLLIQANAKIASINDMNYGDSSLLNLYHLIRDAPASLIQTRQLLNYFDATELSLQTGKPSRPVTILVFTDKVMVVKRKNYSVQGKEYLENVEEHVKNTATSSMLQKAKEAYNGLPLEFKGWADISSVEIFDGLHDRPDTFFLRTCLPEQSPSATEKECEDYFRRSDRLYSIVPTTIRNCSIEHYINKKNQMIELCQKQIALSKLKGKTYLMGGGLFATFSCYYILDTSNELYYENKFKRPAYTHFYDEELYRQAEYKNHILIVYVEDNCTVQQMDLNTMVNENVWIVILLSHHKSGGYKPIIRARTNLIPIRELSREMEYESMVDNDHQHKHEKNAPLDFIDTLWNNIFFYERRLRTTEAFSCIHDGLLRARGRSRSRSKSLTRVASQMSIGKLFARSRSSSPSKHISSEEHEDIMDQAVSSQVMDPVFKVATVNKYTEYKTQASPHLPTDGYYPDESYMSKLAYHHPQVIHDLLYSDANYYQDNSYSRPNPYTRRPSSQIPYSADSLLYTQSPGGIIRPPSGGSNNSTTSSSESLPIDSTPYDLSRASTSGDSSSTSSFHPYNSISSQNSSLRSYFDDKSSDYSFDPRERYGSIRSTTSSATYEEKLMSVIDSSRKSSNSNNRRTSLHPSFYVHPQVPLHAAQKQQQPQRSHPYPQNENTLSMNITQLKDDVDHLIDNLVQSQQYIKAQDMKQYYGNTYESMRSLRSHIVSKIDSFMDNLSHIQQH
ncbi:MAG: hypothetical protein EXX96DRAFT_476421 [Benjaminiella poitrasii]|nr:MAG: hypothetical protein EXX96DRAFT_476421 [Benjaminiella poitrasii]